MQSLITLVISYLIVVSLGQFMPHVSVHIRIKLSFSLS